MEWLFPYKEDGCKETWVGGGVIYEEDGCEETGGAVDGFPGGEAALPLHR